MWKLCTVYVDFAHIDDNHYTASHDTKININSANENVLSVWSIVSIGTIFPLFGNLFHDLLVVQWYYQ